MATKTINAETTETAQRSALGVLLDENLERELSIGEFNTARKLIANPVFSPDHCCVCPPFTRPGEEIPRAIYDTGLCKGHAEYVLVTRK